ncbi:hypothetical protein IPC86_23950 [Pseudomonas aeruginosa]|nr:hypothetical protein IPC86_23950 [Pseudomonas aeruginosa]
MPQPERLGRVIYCANPRQISRRATISRPSPSGGRRASGARKVRSAVGRITAKRLSAVTHL